MDEDFERHRVLAPLEQRHGGGDRPAYRWDPADFLHGFGTVSGAILYAALFVPEFVEVEGRVFLKGLGVRPPGGWEAVAGRVRQARATSPQALRVFLETCNWVEIPYLFGPRDAGDDECAALAALTADAWRARLLDRFADRRFTVRVLGPEESGGVVSVGFVEA